MFLQVLKYDWIIFPLPDYSHHCVSFIFQLDSWVLCKIYWESEIIENEDFSDEEEEWLAHFVSEEMLANWQAFDNFDASS